MRSPIILSSCALIALALATAQPAQAQYFDYTPRPPDVEVDLSVLNDGRPGHPARMAPPQAPIAGNISRHIEAAPLPPLNIPAQNAEGFMPPVSSIPARPAFAAPMRPVSPSPAALSPYEGARVVERIELSGTMPAPSGAASPFNPPAVITAPRPQPEMPRTAPATIVKPQPLSPLDGGDPLLVTGLTDDETSEMPAQNVSKSIKGDPTAPAAAATVRVVKPQASPIDDKPVAADGDIALPMRKPAAIVSVTKPAVSAPVAAPRTAGAISRPPVAILDNPPEPPVMPAGIRSANSVIDDLYALPATDGGVAGEELSPLPTMQHEQAPPLVDTAAAPENGTSAGLLVFDAGSVAIDDAMRSTLADVARTLSKKDNNRLLIRAYANGDGTKADARRISLSRALAVRAQLMDAGVAPNRVDVRAMGKDTTVTPIDRVDLVLSR